jgi:hypothetical protein
MKKLLAISVALTSLSLYGADKPIFSRHGLEGWGKKQGVKIRVEDYSYKDKTFNAQAIKNQIELKLRLAGIQINDKTSVDTIFINCLPDRIGERLIGYSIAIRPTRYMNFEYNGKKYICFQSNAKRYGGVCGVNTFKLNIDKYMDELLLNYLKANPKKKEK